MHKSTTLIPGWSRALSSQALLAECQKVASRSLPAKESLAVLEMEVMKFVAYCGGVTLQFRVDECGGGAPAMLTWGLASTRACPALQQPAPSSGGGAEAGSSSPLRAVSRSSSGGGARPVEHKAVAGATVHVDSISRKPMHMVCTLPGPVTVAPRDVLSIELAPKEDRQPVIMATLRHNNVVVFQRALPCATISSLQLYPFVTLNLGMSLSLHRAVTPSPLFTWHLADPAAPSAGDAHFAELDTCVRFTALPPVQPPPPAPAVQPPPPSAPLELQGSVLFESGRHRWTLQLDNYAPTATHIFVGVMTGGGHDGRGGGAGRSGAGSAFRPLPAAAAALAAAAAAAGPAASADAAAEPGGGGGGASPTPPDSDSSSGSSRASSEERAGVRGRASGVALSATESEIASAAAAVASVATGLPASGATEEPPSGISRAAAGAPGRSSAAGGGAAQQVAADASDADAPAAAAAGGRGVVVPQPARWGAWIRLQAAGASPAGGAPPGPVPPQPVGEPGELSHHAESTSSHGFVTVDLDLDLGYVRFFRNGHLIGSAFQGVTGPITPCLTFVPQPGLSCQGGLVNLTKLTQLDLAWNAEKCSGDLKLTGTAVSKVGETYGDYSTVLGSKGFISGVHLWLVKVLHLSEPDSIFIGVCRGCMPLDQDPQDLRDRTYYLSNGVIRVGGRRVATNAANFTKGDVVGVVLDADQGEIVFFRNGVEQGRARGIRGRLYPFISCDSEGDQVALLGSYSLLLDRLPRQLADMEWDTLTHTAEVELSSNCLTASKAGGGGPSTVRGTILYTGACVAEFHVILDSMGPDGVWVGVAPPGEDPGCIVGDEGAGWALHSDGDKRWRGREEEFAAGFKNGDVLTVSLDPAAGTLSFSRNGSPLGIAFTGLSFPLVAAVTLASEESKVTIQNRPTVLNTGEYSGELRWDEARAGRDLNVIDGLTVTKMANDGGDYATVLGNLCLSSGQHAWNVYINHVEDSNLFIGVSVGGHDLNADPQEMKHRTYYLSNGTIRVAGKLVTRCAEPYAEGDLVTVQLDMEAHKVEFLKNGVVQGVGDGLPDEVWAYISLDNVMDSITLHSSSMFIDLARSLRWNPAKCSRAASLTGEGVSASLRPPQGSTEGSGQATVLGLREYSRTETHTWVVRFEQPTGATPANFLVGVAPPGMDLLRSLGEESCGIGLDFFGYFYVSGRYFHASSLASWAKVAKPVRGSTAKHKGKAQPAFSFGPDGRCEVALTLDLREGTLRFAHNGVSLGTIAGVRGPVHAAATLTHSRQRASLLPGPIGDTDASNEELVHVLRAKGCPMGDRVEAALRVVPRDVFVPRDRQREALRDAKVALRMADGSTLTLPPPSFVAAALELLELTPGKRFLDAGCGTGYVTALAACLLGADGPRASMQGAAAGPSGAGGSAPPPPSLPHSSVSVYGLECVGSRLEGARANLKTLRERLRASAAAAAASAPPEASTSAGTFAPASSALAAAFVSISGSASAGPGPASASAGVGGGGGQSPSPATFASAAATLNSDPSVALGVVDFVLSNVLMPECMDGVTFDALYCDASLSEEDLPVFLSLLRPRGRMIVVIDEEAVLVQRTGDDAHEFVRENVTSQLVGSGSGGSGAAAAPGGQAGEAAAAAAAGVGDFGELEDPTPWEVQEAIRRIKARERRNGMEQAKAEIMSLRSYEYVEMQQRVQAAMARISELEGLVARESAARSPMRAAHQLSSATSVSTSGGWSGGFGMPPLPPTSGGGVPFIMHGAHGSSGAGSGGRSSTDGRPVTPSGRRDSSGTGGIGGGGGGISSGMAAAAAGGSSGPTRLGPWAASPLRSMLGGTRVPSVSTSGLNRGGAATPGSPAADDVRMVVRDKARRGLRNASSFSAIRPESHPPLHTHGLPMPHHGAPLGTMSPTVGSPGAHWKEMYMVTSASAGMLSGGAGLGGEGGSVSERPSARGDDLLLGDAPEPLTPRSVRGVAGYGGNSPFYIGSPGGGHGSLADQQRTLGELLDAMSGVQTFSPEQIDAMIAGARDADGPTQVEGRDVFPGTYKGVRVRVWRTVVPEGFSYLELRRTYSRYCIAHPNICAVLGMCVETAEQVPPPEPPSAPLSAPLSALSLLARAGALLDPPSAPPPPAPASSPLGILTAARCAGSGAQGAGTQDAEEPLSREPTLSGGVPILGVGSVDSIGGGAPGVGGGGGLLSALLGRLPGGVPSGRASGSDGSVGGGGGGGVGGGGGGGAGGFVGVGGSSSGGGSGGSSGSGDGVGGSGVGGSGGSGGSGGGGGGDGPIAISARGAGTAGASEAGSSGYGSDDDGGGEELASVEHSAGCGGFHTVWVVEEAFGEESLHTRLERGLLSWQQVVKIATDITRALAFLQDRQAGGGGANGGMGTPGHLAPYSQNTPRSSMGFAALTPPPHVLRNRYGGGSSDGEGVEPDRDSPAGGQFNAGPPAPAPLLSAYCLRTCVTPSNVHVDPQATKVSVLPALLNQLEGALCSDNQGLGWGGTGCGTGTLLHCDMAYMDPSGGLSSEGPAKSLYALGVVLLQLLTEQGPLGLLSAVKEAADCGLLLNLVPRLPASSEMLTWATALTRLAVQCTQPGGVDTLEAEVLPQLKDLGTKLATLSGTAAMSWEQVEEMVMLPLQPRSSNAMANRRWVRQDFRMRRRLFLDEVAKLGVDGPVHKMEIRRARCFKDSVAVFSGKGSAVWRQPLKVTFVGEAGMDSGGVTREWFCQLSSAVSRHSPDLFWNVGPAKDQLYISPLSNSPSHMKKFQFVGLFMAKAILESAARGKELGTITLNLGFAEPFWKLLLGIPLNLMDLQLLDPTEFRSLMSLLDMDINGLIFEEFVWRFHHSNLPPAAPPGPSLSPTMERASGGDEASASSANTPTAGASYTNHSARTASPFSGPTGEEDDTVTSLPLKPGGAHLKVTNHNKREYVLLKAHKMLVGTIEAQTTAIIDAFHSIIPRDLLDKYNFTSLEMQLLVCGEQRVDIADLRRSCRYDEGYTGKEDLIAWFWDACEALDDAKRRQLLQFWSGSDGMPAEGFGTLEPPFHIVAVERMYDVNDTTARLPAAHTCFRQLDLPRYRSADEVREKLITAITIGQGYMGIS